MSTASTARYAGASSPAWTRSRAAARSRSSAEREARRRERGKGLAAGPALRIVDLDLLLADGVRDLLLLDLGVLVEADALLGDGLLFDDGLFLVEDDLVLFLGDGGAVHGVAGVGVGDRLALDADLFAAHGHGLLDLVLDDVLA